MDMMSVNKSYIVIRKKTIITQENLCNSENVKNQASYELQKVETDNVIKVYNENVKEPFFEVIRLFDLDYTRDKLDKELKDLAKSLSWKRYRFGLVWLLDVFVCWDGFFLDLAIALFMNEGIQ